MIKKQNNKIIIKCKCLNVSIKNGNIFTDLAVDLVS